MSIVLPAMRGVLSRLGYRAAVMADNPIAYWRLGESSGTTAVDEKGLYNGTYVGNPTLGVAGAVAGNTAVSVSSGKYVSLPHNSGRKPQFPFTLECWIYMNAAGLFKNALVLDKFDSVYYGPIIQVSTNNSIAAYIGNGGPAGSISRRSYGTVDTFSSGQWLHIAIVWQSVLNCLIYVNGSSKATTTSGSATNMVYSSNAGRIGENLDGTLPLNSTIDEVAIYDKALSAERILAHYNARISP